MKDKSLGYLKQTISFGSVAARHVVYSANYTINITIFLQKAFLLNAKLVIPTISHSAVRPANGLVFHIHFVRMEAIRVYFPFLYQPLSAIQDSILHGVM